MLRILKKLFKIDLIKKIGFLEKENRELRQKVTDLRLGQYMDSKDPREYIESILKRKIDWYDYKNLDKASWGTYFNEAQQIVGSETFNNELYHYITDLIKFAAIETKEFDQVLHTRTGIIVLETLKKRLEEIENPNKPESNEEPYSPL